MKNTVFPHKFWRPFLDCMPQLFFRPQYVWFLVHLKGHLIPLCYETLVVNWQNWLFTLFHQSRSVLSPNPIAIIVISILLPSYLNPFGTNVLKQICKSKPRNHLLWLSDMFIPQESKWNPNVTRISTEYYNMGSNLDNRWDDRWGQQDCFFPQRPISI